MTQELKVKKKLPKVFKRRWVAALRSGKFTQGQNYLYDKRDNTFCCLGVGEKICGTGLNTLDGETMPDSLTKPNMPKILQTGFEDEKGDTTIAGRLASFNDTPKSFKWIANYIEKNL